MRNATFFAPHPPYALRGAGCIVLLATHDLETIDGLADRAVLLRGGRLLSIDAGAGTLRDRYRRTNRES